jgi:hypothetical protein
VFDVAVCKGGGCALGGFFQGINRRVLDKLSRTRLSAVRIRIGVKHEDEAQDNQD